MRRCWVWEEFSDSWGAVGSQNNECLICSLAGRTLGGEDGGALTCKASPLSSIGAEALCGFLRLDLRGSTELADEGNICKDMVEVMVPDR